jgi:putative MATE family efflux protein
LNQTKESLISRLLKYYRDPEYFRQLLKIGIPIAIQQFAFSLLNMLGNVMIGQRGDVAIAAVGAANQVYFLLNLFLFGVASGSAMVTAQFWGKKDIGGIRKVLALCLWMSIGISSIFLILSELFSAEIISFYSSDSQVILQGGNYLQILAGAFVFFSITFSFGLVLRSIGNVKLPVGISITFLALNILLSYGLIFGKLGLPNMGVLGSAWATMISRVLECFALVITIYIKKSPVAATWQELTHVNAKFFGTIMKPVLPVILNELLWSLGITAYNAIYGHISTEALAAVGILYTVDNIALTIFMGISNATGVSVGNNIGANDQRKAYLYAGRSLLLGILSAFLVGGGVLLSRKLVISFYLVSPETAASAYRLLTIHAFFLWIRATNMIIIIGLLRAGGDTRFSLVLDGFIIWILGVPMALLGAFVFHLPIYWVYLLVMSEEVMKFVLGLRRYFTRKWIHDLTDIHSSGATA